MYSYYNDKNTVFQNAQHVLDQLAHIALLLYLMVAITL